MENITPPRGLSTSQGQFTAIFSVICLILSIVGLHYTPEQLNNGVDLANHLIETFLPLILAMGTIVAHTWGRTKVTEASMSATGYAQAAALTTEGQK